MKKIWEQTEGYIRYCEKVRGMTKTTMVMKRNVLTRFVKATKVRSLEDLTNGVFNKWMMGEIERGVSARSVNMYNAVVVAMVRYYRELGEEVPLNLTLVKKLKEGEVRRGFYTVEEIERVVFHADEETGLMIRMMFETGMRIAEVTRLRLANFRGRQIRFIGKGEKPRKVYITTETLGILRRFVIEREVKDYLWGYYGQDGNDEAPTVNTVRNRLKRAFRAMGYVEFLSACA